MLSTFLLLATVSTASPSLTPVEPAAAPQPTLSAEERRERGWEIARGVKMVVSGSILTLISGAFMAGAIAALTSAPAQTGNGGLVFTVLGWTSFGFGAICAATGIPILIVGIVKLANRRAPVALGVGNNGQLAVTW